VEAMATNVIHILENHKCLDGKLDKLHNRVDKHDGYIKYGMGVCAVIGVALAITWEWIKAKFIRS
jgi:hypothetical protein